MLSRFFITRNQFQVTHILVQDVVNICDFDVPAKEQTCWKLTNHGRHFWNSRNNMTRLEKYGYFEWKYEEQEEGYHKNNVYSLKHKLDAKEDLSMINNLRTRMVELEFLLAKEKSMVEIVRMNVSIMGEVHRPSGMLAFLY
uniref:Uncharacterized protein n=1 Tax=Lactuca sativa TaxID=4236 RepID=A0A9R1UNE1_LACSA|nr:hypothetical protein LSAT_V11C800409010 [Lactuca sativa]